MQTTPHHNRNKPSRHHITLPRLPHHQPTLHHKTERTMVRMMVTTSSSSSQRMCTEVTGLARRHTHQRMLRRLCRRLVSKEANFRASRIGQRNMGIMEFSGDTRLVLLQICNQVVWLFGLYHSIKARKHVA
ncbi:hypothetical protein BT93_L1494 [Corymbia citriodora subsp. variegata]|uniref:Uncharacterized protein n=1 Tax=Corymbia citriodora subsp. variegata TaxID=360336 RepID=A0A8T0CF81_CORYI|nr:hypothetical protein BT93_L1494 [Corymbia citriodora subsp. variegata]